LRLRHDTRANLSFLILTREFITMTHRRQRTISLTLIVSVWVGISSSVFAALPMARLNAISPTGAQRGNAVEVTLDGADLEGASQLYFSRGALTAELLAPNKFRITVPQETALGPIDLRVVGTFGISNPRTFTVGGLQEALEVEPNNLAEQSQTLAVDSVINGTIGARADVDYFTVALQAGQTVVIECIGERIDSQLDGVLTLFSPDGQAIDLSNGYQQKDPRIDFTAQAAGNYRIRLHDLTYNGSPHHFYRLEVHTRPVVDYAYPPVVAPGQETQLTLVGRNLPGGAPMPEATVQGRPMEQLPLKITMPVADARTLLSPESFVTPRQAVQDAFFLHWNDAPPVLVGVATAPVHIEQEPNHAAAEASPIAIPAEIVGRCDKPGDIDLFRFRPPKNQEIEIDAFSERAGFPCDLVFVVKKIVTQDPATGAVTTQDVAEQDDGTENVGGVAYVTSSHDPTFRFTSTEDADYLLEVRDRFAESRGDARFVYRIRVRPTQPDYQLFVAPTDPANPSSILVRAGGTTDAVVYVLRQGGFSGEVSIRVDGLPGSVQASPVVAGPGVVQVPIVLQASADAPDFTGAIRVSGSATLAGQSVAREAKSATIIWPAGGNAPRATRLTQSLCLAVRGKASYLLTSSTPTVKIGQGTLLFVSAQVERKNPDFTDKLAGLSAQFLPPNVDNATVEIPAGQPAATLPIYFKPEVQPGNYSFTVKGTAAIPYTKTPDDPNATKAPVEVADPSPPINVTVVPRPADLVPGSNEPAIKPGDRAQLAITVNRQNGYAGPMTISLQLPPGLVGVTSPEITLPADVSQTFLPIQVAADVPVGDKGGLSVRGVARMGEDLIPVDARITVKVVP
jgi:hypothetical protein